MGMSDPILNCVLEVCCGLDEAQTRFAQSMVDDGVCDTKEHAQKCAAWVYENFDLAPVGSLHRLKKDIAKLARGQSGSSAKAEG